MVLPSLVTVVSLVIVAASLVAFFTVDSGPAGAGSPADVARPDRTGQLRDPVPRRSPHSPSERSAHQRPARPARTPGTLSDAYVEVYNNSGVSGLAELTAARLQDIGWQVVATDDWYGNIPENTVYYPPELKDQATELANDLNIRRTWPAVSPMKFDRLTVILTGAVGG